MLIDMVFFVGCFFYLDLGELGSACLCPHTVVLFSHNPHCALHRMADSAASATA
jgi:hypothetical protein